MSCVNLKKALSLGSKLFPLNFCFDVTGAVRGFADDDLAGDLFFELGDVGNDTD